jgi:hypothetical protein
VTPRDAFLGKAYTAGNRSMITLYNRDPSIDPTGAIDMATFEVYVSPVVVSSIGSSSNRKLEAFLNTTSPFAGFLGTTSMNTSTTSSNTTGVANIGILPTLVGGATGSVTTVAELESRYAVNGNRNILAVTGDLTINCPTSSTVFTMVGVRTVIVTGNLIIKCNIVYGSSDTTSSWAWIIKNGNIQVSNGTGPLSSLAVTNLAGVYVAVKEPGFSPVAPNTTAGEITYIGRQYSVSREPSTVMHLHYSSLDSMLERQEPMTSSRLVLFSHIPTVHSYRLHRSYHSTSVPIRYSE